jgi:hypothetical protein
VRRIVALAMTGLPLSCAASRPAPAEPSLPKQECATCHSEIATEWQRSAHRRSYENPIFRAAVALEPTPFCRGCHAPEADPQAPPSAAARALGVACVSCHPRAHEGGATRTCDGCHQFGFPNRPSVPMQNTVAEHARSSFAERSCQSCHMPRVRGGDGRIHVSHDVTVSPSMVRQALIVDVERTEPSALTVRLRAGVVGHAVPTGDLFRRLEVEGEVVGDDGDVIDSALPRALTRTFRTQLTDAGADRIPVADTRVPPPGDAPPLEVVLRFLPEMATRAISWRVSYLRMESEMARVFGIPSHQNRVVLFEGTAAP